MFVAGPPRLDNDEPLSLSSRPHLPENAYFYSTEDYVICYADL